MAYYNDEQIKMARNSDLLEYLNRSGYEFMKSGRNEFRLKKNDSLVISNNKWHWFSRGIGGNTLDFLMKYEGKKLPEAVEELIGKTNIHSYGNTNVENYKAEKEKNEVKLELPEKNKDYRRLFAYLIKSRGIDKNIVQDMVNEKLIYESKDTHNVVFLGKDEKGNIKYANMRGTLTKKPFKGDCTGSKKEYGFSLKGKSDTLYVFESAIDLLSHATLTKMKRKDYRKDHRIIAGGVSALSLHQYLKNNPSIKNITLCLDNDKAGKDATKRITDDLKVQGNYNVLEKFPPSGKDWNEYLKKYLFKMKKREDRDII